jgi:hypothetical protein
VGRALGAVERHADDAQDLVALVLRQLRVHEVQRPPVFVQLPNLTGKKEKDSQFGMSCLKNGFW